MELRKIPAMNQLVKTFYNYNAAVEQGRLDLPLCRIGFASTLRLIDKYFPKQGCVCDIGGGPGRYVIEMIRRGYANTLVDLSDVAAETCELAQYRDSTDHLHIVASKK